LLINNNSEKNKLLSREIDNLKNKNNNFENEIERLKDENKNLISIKQKLEKELLSLKEYNKGNSGEQESLRKENANLKAEINKLKGKISKITEEKNNLEKELLFKKIEEKQMEVIEFYLRSKKISKDSNEINFSPKIKLLEEIDNNYGILIDSNKFTEIALYYIKSKLEGQLKEDPKTSEIFSNPIISKNGTTFEGNKIDKKKDYVENKLIFKICEIIRKNGESLNMDDFNIIKKLLKNERNDYYKNPVVISTGNNKGETKEGNDDDENYKNLAISNIINGIRELLEDDFFKFEGIKTNEGGLENFKSGLFIMNDI